MLINLVHMYMADPVMLSLFKKYAIPEYRCITRVCGCRSIPERSMITLYLEAHNSILIHSQQCFMLMMV